MGIESEQIKTGGPYTSFSFIAPFRVYKHCNCNANVPTMI